VEHFFNLLQEAFPVKGGGADEGVLSEQDVLALEGGVEAKSMSN
jgi:hypothetical protein